MIKHSGVKRLLSLFFLITTLFFSINTTANSIIGTTPPPWKISDWINSEPVALNNLKGRVVLVRWWTAPDCPFCSASSHALNEWHKKYQGNGLTVIGIYHHKVSAPLSVEKVRDYVNDYDFRFPVAIDYDWNTLRDWWFRGEDRDWTSVSFLLDREGVVRHIHPGGTYVKGDAAYEKLQGEIQRLLNES